MIIKIIANSNSTVTFLKYRYIPLFNELISIEFKILVNFCHRIRSLNWRDYKIIVINGKLREIHRRISNI